jgi:hypothetical protein
MTMNDYLGGKMIKRFLSVCMIAVLLIGNLVLFAQDDEEKGKLNEFEEEVKKDDKSQSEQSEEAEQKENYRKDNHHRSGFFESILQPVFEFLFYVTFIGPPGDESLVDRDWFWSQHFSVYPYESSNDGLYTASSLRKISCNIYGQYLNQGSDLYGLSLRNQFLPLPFISLELDYSYFSERLEKSTDHLHLVNFFVNYHRVRSEFWTLWWGLGTKGVIGENGHFGAALNFGTIIYPGNPVSLQAEYNTGSINSTSVQELLLQLNYHLNQHIIYMGYQKHTAGSTDLDGFIVGTGMYF